MSEELIQKNYLEHGEPFGEYEYYNIGKTNFGDLAVNKIVPNIDYKEYKLKCPDSLICDRRDADHPTVVCVIEYKKPSEFNTDTKKNKAFQQCNNYAQECNAKISIVTDGHTFYWLNSVCEQKNWDYTYYDEIKKITRGFSFIKNENKTLFKEFFDHGSAESINSIELLQKTISEKNSLIRPAQMISPSSLAKKVWQSVYMSTGDDPKKCLMTFNYLGTDYDELTIILAKANYLITLIELVSQNPAMTKKFSEVFSSVFKLMNKSIIGSLEQINENHYDLIMSNPPYISSGKGLYTKYIDARDELKKYYNTTAVGKEGLFLQKIISELKPNGKAFVILPDGFFYRPTDDNLKAKLIEECYIDAIISLPTKTFYATTKKTYILCFTKKSNPTINQATPVFAGIVNQIGETLDTDRIPCSENDLLLIAKEFKKFVADKETYTSGNNKIKVIDFDLISKNKNWLIENYWSDSELVSLGIKKETRNLSDDDIFENIENNIKKLSNIKESLSGIIDEIKSDETEYITFSLTDESVFEFIPAGLGLTRKEYSLIDTKNDNDIPVYTAAKAPVAYFSEYKTQPLKCNSDSPLISFASDGDGTAGTNIFYHTTPFYINTSRRAFKILNPEINPKYVFYYIQDMKKQYQLDFRFKANNSYLEQITICVPVKNNKIDQELQNMYIAYYEHLQIFKKNLLNEFFETIDQFKDDIDHQLDKKLKSFLNINAD